MSWVLDLCQVTEAQVQMNDNVAPEMLDVQKKKLFVHTFAISTSKLICQYCPRNVFLLPRVGKKKRKKKSKSVMAGSFQCNFTALMPCQLSMIHILHRNDLLWCVKSVSTTRQSSGKIAWEALICLWEEYCLFIQIYPPHLQDEDNVHFFVSALVPPVMDAETHRMRY